MATVLYVQPKDDTHQAMLVEHYEYLGYYVKVVDGRLRVTWTRPAKPKAKKNEEKRTRNDSDREDTGTRNSGSRPQGDKSARSKGTR